MDGLVERFKSPIFIVDIILATIILGFLAFFMLKILKRKLIVICYPLACLLYIVSIIFGLTTLSFVIMTIIGVATLIFLFINISELRPLLANPLKSRKTMNVSYDKEGLFKVINDTVLTLSKSKTGAIITFERKTALNDVVKTGTMINAPVSQELLLTIFYPGTRLHDGAVVIRGNIIVAASVFYTPTTRALTGKYGSRHRAAFGISEVTDSVTVVVSEETGRISIACNGLLESVNLDTFYQTFVDFMTSQN